MSKFTSFSEDSKYYLNATCIKLLLMFFIATGSII